MQPGQRGRSDSPTGLTVDNSATSQGGNSAAESAEKDRLIADYEEVLDIYKKHVARLEKLVKLKDNKIEMMKRKLDDSGVR